MLGAKFDCSAAVAGTAAGRLLPVGEAGSSETEKVSINVGPRVTTVLQRSTSFPQARISVDQEPV